MTLSFFAALATGLSFVVGFIAVFAAMKTVERHHHHDDHRRGRDHRP